jgi:phosphatidylglycerophosphatase A
MKSLVWEQSATELADLTNASPWADIASSFTTILEDPSLQESFATAEDVVPILAETADIRAENEATEPAARRIKLGLLYTLAIYIVSALALHISNFMTAKSPVFDPHQFLTDEFIAMALALAFYCSFWKD